MRTTTRITGFAAAIAVVAVLLSPAIGAQAAAPTLVGTTGGYGDAWVDTEISSEFTVGVPYSDTIQAPPCCSGYGGIRTDIPSWMSADIDSDGTVTLYGTPASAGDDIYVEVDFGGSDGTYFSIEFSIDVVAATIATTTSVTTATFSPYSGVNLQATVSSSTSGGTVDFYIANHLVAANVFVGGTGTATYTGAVDPSFVGGSHVVKAVFSGSSTHTASTSTSDPLVYIYGDREISGSVQRNRVGESGTAITLLTAGSASTGISTTTDADGLFTVELPAPTSLADAKAGYKIEATDLGLYYSDTAGWKLTNAGLFDATTVNESQWEVSSLTLYLSIYPEWTDQTLAQPRMGETYSDSVAATTIGEASDGTPATVTYSLTGTALPSWLSFNAATGLFTSTGPADQDPHTFTVRVDTDFGWMSKQFTLQAGDAGIAPTFDDTTIAALQVGTALTDAVTATGDPTIAYTSTPLPAGLQLDSATGALTGTPTTAGDYEVTFTATNEFGSATYIWEPTVAARPDLDLVLNFAAGSTLEQASTEIGAGGLKVNSTYTLYIHSAPKLLFTGTVDASGAFLHTISLPADTPVGAHELILTGTAPDGTVMTAHAWFTLLPNGTIGAVSYAGPLAFSLAFTGSEPLVPLGIASALLLAGYLVMRRTRSARIS